MAQPTAYDRQNSFTALAAASPSDPYTGADLDEEFNAVKVTLDEILANLALIQRDDGDLKNQSVGPDQLAASLSIGINPPSAWAASTAYALYDTVFNGTILYKALVAHTSGSTFSTDLAASKWEVLAEFNTVAVGDGSISTAKLADLAVTSAKIASSGVTTNKIADSAVTTAKINDAAVTNAKIGAAAVATSNLQDTAVTTAKLDTAAVTTAKLADAALTALGALTPAADKFAYYTSSSAAALASITAAGLALLDDASASAQRTTLGLGTAAVANTGTSAGNVVVLDGSAKLPAVDGSQLTNLPASGALVLIRTQVASADSAIDFTTNDGDFSDDYDAYELVLTDIVPGTDQVTPQLLVGTGATPTYQTSGYLWGHVFSNSADTLSLTGNNVARMRNTSVGGATTSIALSSDVIGNVGGERFTAKIEFNDPESTGFHTLRWQFSLDDGANSSVGFGSGAGRYNTAGAITGLRIKMSSGTFSGRLSLYARAKA